MEIYLPNIPRNQLEDLLIIERQAWRETVANIDTFLEMFNNITPISQDLMGVVDGLIDATNATAIRAGTEIQRVLASTKKPRPRKSRPNSKGSAFNR